MKEKSNLKANPFPPQLLQFSVFSTTPLPPYYSNLPDYQFLIFFPITLLFHTPPPPFHLLETLEYAKLVLKASAELRIVL